MATKRAGFEADKTAKAEKSKVKLKKARLLNVDGQLVLEIPTLVRVPIQLEAITRSLGDDVRLTPQEKIALNGLLKGWSNKEIANAMGLSERTVKFYVSALLVKFVVQTRGELMHVFMKDRT